MLDLVFGNHAVATGDVVDVAFDAVFGGVEIDGEALVAGLHYPHLVGVVSRWLC